MACSRTIGRTTPFVNTNMLYDFKKKKQLGKFFTILAETTPAGSKIQGVVILLHK
jgi:hypothetical protein